MEGPQKRIHNRQQQLAYVVPGYVDYITTVFKLDYDPRKVDPEVQEKVQLYIQKQKENEAAGTSLIKQNDDISML